jgi:hypothetical protein
VIIPDTVWRAVKTELDKIKSNWSIHGEVKWRYFAPGNSDATNTMLHLSQDDKNSVRNEIYEILTKRCSIKCWLSSDQFRPPIPARTSTQDDLYQFTYKPITERFQYYLQDLERDSGQPNNGIIVCDHRGPPHVPRTEAEVGNRGPAHAGGRQPQDEFAFNVAGTRR